MDLRCWLVYICGCKCNCAHGVRLVGFLVPAGARRSQILRLNCNGSALCYLRHLLRCPFEIGLNFLCILRALLEPCSRLGKSGLSFRLQFQELAVLGVELARSAESVSFIVLKIAPRAERSMRKNSRLCLHRQAAIQRNWVERLGEAVLDILVEVNTAG
jgi:hypothetical protein